MTTPPTPFDWAARYAELHTPWDLGGPHPELVARLAAGEWGPPRPGARALVPGCGRGHDALALAEAGWDVTALDVVPELAATLGPALAALGSRLSIEDALAHRAATPYDLFFEHTFFCALEPALRPAWGELARASVAPGGRLIALLFPVGKPAEAGGPPHGVALSEVRDALGDGWRSLEHAPVAHGVARRTWGEEVAAFARC